MSQLLKHIIQVQLQSCPFAFVSTQKYVMISHPWYFILIIFLTIPWDTTLYCSIHNIPYYNIGWEKYHIIQHMVWKNIPWYRLHGIFFELFGKKYHDSIFLNDFTFRGFLPNILWYIFANISWYAMVQKVSYGIPQTYTMGYRDIFLVP